MALLYESCFLKDPFIPVNTESNFNGFFRDFNGFQLLVPGLAGDADVDALGEIPGDGRGVIFSMAA